MGISGVRATLGGLVVGEALFAKKKKLESLKDGEALSSVHFTALAAGKLIHNSALRCRWHCDLCAVKND